MDASEFKVRRETTGLRQLLLSLFVVATLALAIVLSGCEGYHDLIQDAKGLTEEDQPPADDKFVGEAFAEIQHGNYTQAEAFLESALQVNPNNPFALLNLGFVYEKTGREDDARAIYGTLIRQDPPHMAERAGSDGDVGRRVVDIASDNLARIDRKIVARAARGTESPLHEEPLAAQQDLESDWRARMVERVAILDELKQRQHISENEMTARIGGAWSRSHSDPSPNAQSVYAKLDGLDVAQRQGHLGPKAYADQRNAILDRLAPIKSMPAGIEPPRATARMSNDRNTAEHGTQSVSQRSAQDTAHKSAMMAPKNEMPKMEVEPVQAAPAPEPEAATTEMASAHEAPTVTMPERSVGENIRIHIASYRSEDEAERNSRTLKWRNADLLANLDFNVKSVNLQAKGKYYRIMFGPLPDRKAAANLCAKLKARDLYCDIAG